MAEGVLRHHIQTNGLRIKVDSAGTNGYHNGEAPDRRAQQEMRRHGIDISKQVSRQIARKDFDDFDLILVMDESNLQDVTALAGDREDWVDKIHLFLEEDNVPDPYYGGADGFAHVYELVDEAAADWVRRWKSGVLA
jgi:protein-tyrosine phosphatase